MVWAGWISLSGCLTRFIYLNLAAAQGRPYAGVALHQGSSVLEWLCAGWLCAGVAMRRGGYALGWLCAGVAMRWVGYALGWLCAGVAIHCCAGAAICGSSFASGKFCVGVALRWVAMCRVGYALG